MSQLAKFLSWCFAAAAFVFGWMFLANLRYIPYFLHLGAAAFHGPQAAMTVWLALLPPVAAVVYATAWWTTRKTAAHASAWAIAASILNILLGLIPLLLFWRFPAGGRVFISLAIPALLLLFTGVAGVVVFSRCDVLPQVAAQAPRSSRRPGDGTSGLVDIAVQLGGIAAVLAGLFWLGPWGEARGLPPSLGLWFWVELFAADLFVVAVHELGHTAVGRALGMRLRAFTVGPFRWHIREGQWTFQFQPANILSLTGGSAGLVPTRLTDSPWREVCMIAAGPAANLCLGLAAMGAMFAAKGRPWEPAWQ
ncbi:MAG TPA: site-2 protease family protein [Candidatus Dormibacteraeota bacterium]|nr:site-2 protease family protein [Candidatus Dormibacteraeota bacterium]